MDGTTTTTTGGAEGEQLRPSAPSDEAQILATAVGDQCVSCGARLAPDQRYCVECGERRGRPRYSLPGSGTGASVAMAPSRWQRTPWSSGGGALLAGIAVLLIALGVGVLIGRTSNSNSGNSPLKVITVAGAAGAAPAASTPTTSGSAASTPGTSGTSGTSRTRPSKVKKVTAKTAAAALVAKLPPKARVIPPALKSKVVKQGQACTSGERGCTNGHFTGTFFGGGG